MTFLGAWSVATTYATGDAVSYSDCSSYISLVGSNTNNQPDTSPSQWGLLCQAGAADISGVTEEPRVQGISDFVLYYDTSAAANRRVMAGMLRNGRGSTTVSDECFFRTTSDVYEGRVVGSTNGSGAAISAGTGSAGHPGVIQLSTGTTATGKIALFSSGSTSSVLPGGGKIRYGGVMKIDTLSTGAQTYTIRLGLGDSSTAEPNDGVYFRYTDGVNGGRWQGVARNGGTESTIDTTIAADTSYHTFEYEINAAANSVQFYIDGTAEGAAVVTNIPSTSGHETGLLPIGIVKSVGTTAVTFQADAWWYVFEFTTAR